MIKTDSSSNNSENEDIQKMKTVKQGNPILTKRTVSKINDLVETF